jgi:hypothetical protein
VSASFLWLAGKVVNEGSGIFKIKPLQKIPRLVVKDLRHDPLNTNNGRPQTSQLPFSMLDEVIIAP